MQNKTIMGQYIFLCLTILTLASVYGSMAVEYVVSNTAESSIGGQKFDKSIGADYAKQTMNSATDFILKLFQENVDAADRKNVEEVKLVIENIEGVAFDSNNEIHVSASFIERFNGDIKSEITGMLYHEMTHVWQWNANGQAPSGLIEGIADFVRLKAGYVSNNWVPPGRGDDWFQGYDVTARFLDYCNTIENGFVAELNKKMKSSYSDTYFVELLGKPVSQLWSDYKAKYAIN
ncbi:PREDICTED: uncharacterized protein LOC109352179 [Lupinus angustifolius]|nr:PREDICTED: uncharacterized protein LOC109352179 [Lupinus angustifolius]